MDNTIEIHSNLISKLNETGLNIFISKPLNELSSETRCLLQNSIPQYHEYRSVIIIGNGGKDFWEKSHNRFDHLNVPSDDHPVDNFCIRYFQSNCSSLLENEYKIIYPDQTIKPPLQRLLRESGLSHQSPLGLDICVDFGVWFAVRIVILTKDLFPTSKFDQNESPCQKCINRTCEVSCPVNAVNSHQLLNFNQCLTHRKSLNSNCKDNCHARFNCSYKPEHKYTSEQMNYHMLRSYYTILKMHS